MSAETSAALGLKDVIAQDVLRCEIPVRSNLRRVDVLVNVGSGNRTDRNEVEAVHAPVVPGLAPIGIAVAGRESAFEVGLTQPQGTVMRLADGGSVGAGTPREQVVERAVLLHEDDDVREVLTLLRRRRGQKGSRRG